MKVLIHGKAIISPKMCENKLMWSLITDHIWQWWEILKEGSNDQKCEVWYSSLWRVARNRSKSLRQKVIHRLLCQLNEIGQNISLLCCGGKFCLSHKLRDLAPYNKPSNKPDKIPASLSHKTQQIEIEQTIQQTGSYIFFTVSTFSTKLHFNLPLGPANFPIAYMYVPKTWK